MKTALFALLLFMTAVAFAQIPAEKPVFENYTQRTAPRFGRMDGVKLAAPEYEASYRHIKPPLEDVRIKKATDLVDSQKGGTIRYASGSSITIPAHAFVDENGNPVTEKVTIGWREFKNPVDFILSGIPMSYKDGEGTNQFASAGMFELTASVNGKEVFLKKGEKINVRMASMDESPDYNLYAFNDNTGSWEMRSDKRNVSVSRGQTYFYSRGITRYMNLLSWYSRPVYDSTKCQERFESLDYYYTRRKDSKKIKTNLPWWQARTVGIKISSVKKTNDGQVVFHIGRTIGSNRELTPYQLTMWMLEDTMSLQQFKEFTGSKNHFSDIRIKKDGEQYIILLKGQLGFKQVRAVPVKWDADHEAEAYSAKDDERMYARYSRLLSDREKYFDKYIRKGKIQYNDIQLTAADKPLYAWKNVRNSMDSVEQSMSFEQWKAYVTERKRAELEEVGAQEASSSSIIRSFSVSGMGVWNCDQIKRLEDPVKVIAKYTGEKGLPVEASATFIVDKSLNGVLQYYEPQIAFSSRAETVLIAIMKDGGIGVVLPEHFKERRFANNGSYTFPLQELGAGAASVNDLKKLTGL